MGAGYVDEERLVQPVVFPAFARKLLGYEPGADLAAEETNTEGMPDLRESEEWRWSLVLQYKIG